MILVFLLYFVCATMFTISKGVLAYVQPIFFVAFRMILAGLLLLGYSIFKEYKKNISLKNIFKNITSDWWVFSQLIIFHVYLTYICDLCALKNISSVESAFIYNLSPFVAAFFSYFWFNEKMTGKKWIGLAIGFLSLLPMLIGQYTSGSTLTSFTPQLLTLIAVISSSYGWILVRDLVANKKYSTFFVNGFSMFIGGAIALVTSIFTEPWTPYPFTEFIPFLQLTVLIIITANLIFYNLYGYLLKFYTATFLSFAGFTCPIFAGILGWFFLSEYFSSYLLLSFIFVSIGLYIFHQEELRQGYVKKSPVSL